MTVPTLKLGERNVELRLSEQARAQLEREAGPLDVEMELYFSCLLRKRVYFREAPHTDVAARASLSDKVSVSFRPVMTRHCTIGEVEDAPEVEAAALVRTAAFTPKWLALDYAQGKWEGEFGY